jgi:hypothetical protein
MDMTDVDNIATEELLGGGRKRVKRCQEGSEGGGDRFSGWETLKACVGLSQFLTNLVLCSS